MGAVLEMTKPCILARLALAGLIGLAGCGNDPGASDLNAPFQMLGAALKARLAKGAPTLTTLEPAALSALRVVLEKDGQPILLVSNGTLKFAGLMAPFGMNGDVQTWSTEQYVTLSARDGILLATRGFGPDLMSADAPRLAQIASGQGSLQRRYYYLDGADQTQSYAYDCVLARDGTETIAILGKPYATNRIAESCSGPAGSFQNRYWFDNRRILRQSHQFLVPGVEPLILQRVID
jgi:hypothetical protein